MDKEVVVHNGILLSYIKRNAFNSVLMRWLNLETILKREVSESFKNVIYNYKRTNKVVAKTSSELDGDGFWSKFC
jgi:hypothetical protein